MDAPRKYLIVVGGPTASGKTSLAITLAGHFDTEILSADSRQFYREMRIGNARPRAEELAAVPHHFVADRSVTEPLSAGEFARLATEKLNQIFKTKDYAVLVGGSGLFIRALTEGLDTFPDVPPAIRQRVDEWANERGLPFLQTQLAKLDPVYSAEVDQQNGSRIRRALEVCLASGQPYSSFRQTAIPPPAFTPIYLQPTWPREVLYERINQRVKTMVEEGLEAEVKTLLPQQNLPALRTVGYQEWFPYFDQKIDQHTVITDIQQNSRRYAKRQLTWNRRDGYWKAVPRGELRVALAYVRARTQEQLTLAKSQPTRTKILHKKEQVRSLELRKNNQPIARAASVTLDNWALLYQLKSEQPLTHLASALLWHEAVHRSEAATVYTCLPVAADSVLAWEPIHSDELPKALQNYATENRWWSWLRDSGEQLF
ncbi:MAG: tRNA (adenosine(37)-N6)-dimethylallyltransferase MiaA [Bacteroidota bacterium]